MSIELLELLLQRALCSSSGFHFFRGVGTTLLSGVRFLGGRCVRHNEFPYGSVGGRCVRILSYHGRCLNGRQDYTCTARAQCNAFGLFTVLSYKKYIYV